LKTVIILGSSRKDGATAKIAQTLQQISKWEIIDLMDYNISHYDYEHKNKNDDFLPLINKIINNYDLLIFVTPVYWYSMSGIMKVFFDRLSDLLSIEKELGRKLRNKSMAAISSSAGDHLEDLFWIPFIKTSQYFGMKYCGNLHTLEGKDETHHLKKFVNDISNL
jgi:multimeric flavodoxin WrbA